MFNPYRYRFIEISYIRDEELHKGKTIPAHTEKVVIFLPDIWSCVPTVNEYSSLKRLYGINMLKKLGPHIDDEKPLADDATTAPEATPEENSQSQALILIIPPSKAPPFLLELYRLLWTNY